MSITFGSLTVGGSVNPGAFIQNQDAVIQTPGNFSIDGVGVFTSALTGSIIDINVDGIDITNANSGNPLAIHINVDPGGTPFIGLSDPFQTVTLTNDGLEFGFPNGKALTVQPDEPGDDDQILNYPPNVSGTFDLRGNWVEHAAQTASLDVADFNSTGAMYEVSGYINVTAIAGLEGVETDVNYTDLNGNSVTRSLLYLVGSDFGPSPVIEATGTYSFVAFVIRTQDATTNINFAAVVSGTGSITYDVGIFLRQLSFIA